MAFRKRGRACQTAELGEQAVKLAKDDAYDIIVLDVALPDIDGFEVIQPPKWDGVETPLLLESGFSGQDPVSKGAVLGLDESRFLTAEQTAALRRQALVFVPRS